MFLTNVIKITLNSFEEFDEASVPNKNDLPIKMDKKLNAGEETC